MTLSTGPRAQDTDQALVDRAREGDRKAFRELVEKYQHQVARTVVSMLGPSSDVDDVVQDVFLRCYETIGRFRGEASFSTYLKKIAMNKSLDVLRRRKRFLGRFISKDDDQAGLPERSSDARVDREKLERAASVHAAIAKLPDKQRAVVVLRLIEGYSTEETASILDIAYGTVLSRLSRAQQRLKELLAPLQA